MRGNPTTVAAPVLNPPRVTGVVLPGAQQGVAYGPVQLVGSGGVGPYTWALQGARPNSGGWLTLSSGGALSGTPVSQEVETFVVVITDAVGSTGGANFVLPVTGAVLQVTTASIGPAVVGAGYSQTMAAAGGVPPYSWFFVSATGGNTWTCNAFGVFGGTPVSAETDQIVLQVRDSVGTVVNSPTYFMAVGAGAAVPTWKSGTVIESLTVGSAYSRVLQGGTVAAPNLVQETGTPTLAITAAATQQTPPGGYVQGLPPGVTLNSGTGVLAGTPTTGGNWAYTLTASDNSLQADWIARSTGPGVVGSQLFTSAAPVNAFRFTNGVGWDPTPANGSVGSFISWNASEGRMGQGALQIAQMPAQNMSSTWWKPFDPSLTGAALGQENPSAIGYGPGQGFYVQFAVKPNQAGVTGTGEGRKFFSVSRTIMTDTDQEIVSIDQNYRGLYQSYQGYGVYPGTSWASPTAYNPIQSAVGGSDFNLQPGSTYGNYCSYQQVNGGNKANCWLLTNNVWTTYLVYVLPSSYQTNNGHYTVWAWQPGMSAYVQIMDVPNLGMKYGENGSHVGVDNFNAMVFWIYDTNSTGTSGGATQLYDQIIWSTQPIPRPAL